MLNVISFKFALFHQPDIPFMCLIYFISIQYDTTQTCTNFKKHVLTGNVEYFVCSKFVNNHTI